ncbi:patatin-like phospholipase family protein [Primorskyibacter flagellatus]|uniref:patatin-like phospholipase family protein n=1 Tax=Primorskyibacter flagellatus TaxID=1387277 RepID=UPI003A94CC0C
MAKPVKKRINLALQGGGAHGAYTWGVLDRLLEEPDLEIAGISGTSAGALNGAALKAGMRQGGREQARDNLDWLWGQIGAVKDLHVPAWMGMAIPEARMISGALEWSLPYMMADSFSRMVSPYVWGPFYRNPLELIVSQFHYDDVCGPGGPDLFICATNVRDGKVRVFSGDSINADVVMASACLPTLFQAVTLRDPRSGKMEPFWDGGYTGNPALFPLFAKSLPDDLVIININPIIREKLPTTPPEIQNRINEISFNSSLLRELRAINFVQRLMTDGSVTEGAMKSVLVHMISDDALMNDLSVATKTIAIPSVLSALKAAGRTAAGTFLETHWDDLNVRQTADLKDMFD